MIVCTLRSLACCLWLGHGTQDTCNFDVPTSEGIQSGTSGHHCTAVAQPAPPESNLINRCYTRALLPLQRPVFAISSARASSRAGSSLAAAQTWSPLWSRRGGLGELDFVGLGRSGQRHLAAHPLPFAHIRPFTDSTTHSGASSKESSRSVWGMYAFCPETAQLQLRRKICYTLRWLTFWSAHLDCPSLHQVTLAPLSQVAQQRCLRQLWGPKRSYSLDSDGWVGALRDFYVVGCKL